MKRFLFPLISFLVAALVLPTFVSAKGLERGPNSSQVGSAVLSERHDNGLHLGQLKHDKQKKNDKDDKDKGILSSTVLRGTVSAINGSQLILSSSGTRTTVDASNAMIFQQFWGKMRVSDLRVNDTVVVLGTRIGSTLKARLIFDLSQQGRTETFVGTVVADSLSNGQFKVQASSTIYSVNARQARIVSSSGTVLTLPAFKAGDQVRIVGTTIAGSNIINASLITNLSLASSTVYRIGMTDIDRMIDARVGDRLLIDLSDQYRWTASSSNEGVVGLLRGPSLQDEGLYQVNGMGSSTLSIVGDPICRFATPACAAPSLLLRVQVRVQ